MADVLDKPKGGGDVRPKGRTGRRLLITSPKGGVGKSTTSRNTAVAAAVESGLKVAILDLDPQRGCVKWFAMRPDDKVVAVDMYDGAIETFEDAFAEMDEDYDLVVIDTPTSVEEHKGAMKRIILSCDAVLIPTGQHWDDTKSVTDWMKYVRSCGARASFLLNRCKPRTKSFKEARVALLKAGPLCPVEIPDREDIPTLASAGLTVVDVNGMKSSDEVIGVWLHLKNEMGF